MVMTNKKRAGASIERPIEIHYSPSITATGSPEQFQAQLSQHSQEIARMVGHEVQRQKELRG
jgi:hypothetical protein